MFLSIKGLRNKTLDNFFTNQNQLNTNQKVEIWIF